ncbi:MAG: hypothetical protein Q8Q14_00135, partial [Gemmatimonadales bacterium]|nr:hypothetical protein [Gemmatimonadales bacterium]
LLAVVYGQFHYAVDALAGLVVAAVILAIMPRVDALGSPVAAAARVPSGVSVGMRGGERLDA